MASCSIGVSVLLCVFFGKRLEPLALRLEAILGGLRASFPSLFIYSYGEFPSISA